MAVARQVQIGRTENGAFAIQRDVIVDPSTGRAATVEKVTVAVPTEDGNVAIVQQQRVRLVETGGIEVSCMHHLIYSCIVCL